MRPQHRLRPEGGLSQRERELWRSFLALGYEIGGALDAELQLSCGLALSEYEALEALALAPGRELRMGDLANRLLLTKSGTTRMIMRLEEAGYVARDACGDDKRGVFVSLSDLGLRRFEIASALYVASLRSRFFNHLRGDFRTMSRLLGRLKIAAPGTEAQRQSA